MHPVLIGFGSLFIARWPASRKNRRPSDANKGRNQAAARRVVRSLLACRTGDLQSFSSRASGPIPVRDHHTRSLCAQSPAQSEQWCCSTGRGRIISGSAQNRGNSCHSAIDQRPQASLLESLAIRPELRIADAAAQTRIVSVARIPLDPGNHRDLSKGYFATTFPSSSPTTSATQSGLPELGWKTLADIS
jgi:hypothetical protein